ncbi:MAG: thioesterase family protein [Anaerolineales bacterium]|jgi:predicted thioesterase
MMDEIKIGLVKEAQRTVTQEMTADHIGSGRMQVFATPAMVAFIEQECRRMADERLPEGQSTVGIEIDVRHRAPTPLGGKVRLRAEITGFDGRQIEYQVRVWDQTELIGDATHVRAIIDEARFLQRVESKQA